MRRSGRRAIPVFESVSSRPGCRFPCMSRQHPHALLASFTFAAVVMASSARADPTWWATTRAYQTTAFNQTGFEMRLRNDRRSDGLGFYSYNGFLSEYCTALYNGTDTEVTFRG